MQRNEFIKQRMNTWLGLQQSIDAIDGRDATRPDEATILNFIQHYRRTIADLSLVRSLFPRDPLISELGALLCKAILLIGRGPRSDAERIASFFRERYPAVLLRFSRFFLLSSLIFCCSTIFGFAVTRVNPFFANAIVGDEYVYMTADNIEKGHPFAVYQSKFKYAMSGFIMANNIKVAFSAFAFGIFYGVGTFLILIFNGLMLGSLSAVFFDCKLLFGFATTVLVHGTLELFAIMVAGAAGLRLGQSLFRPGMLSRKRALADFGVEAFIMTLAMVPIFVMAGALEGYVTPLGLPAVSRVLIITGNMILLAAYFGLPLWFFHKKQPLAAAPPEVKVKY